MRTAAVIVGLTLICITCGAVEVEWACRDRHLWIRVTSEQTVQFEAVDDNGVHAISAQVASHCGYTISTFKADGCTTLRASYYSCFTHMQDDQFTFRFNVMLSDGGPDWISRPVSAVCSGLSWVHREIVCEEDYMEVNVQRESSCAAQPGRAGREWHAALSQAQKIASSAHQLMFLQRDGQLTPMSVMEAESSGYSLILTAKRAVLRSPYNSAKAQLITLDGVPVEVVHASLFYKQQLTVVMIDMSMACTVNSASFDGAQLVWDVPGVLKPLLEEGVAFKHLHHSLGVGGVLMDEASIAARGFSLAQQDNLVQILVPFGAEGGYKKSLVVNNVYMEKFVISLLYEHMFSVVYQDGSSVDTKHRTHRVLDTPLRCRPPFSIDQTVSEEQVFSIYLGNIPKDVILQEVQINGKLLETDQQGTVVSPIIHLNGSRAYQLQVPFPDTVVKKMYVGEGMVQYSIDVNFTLTIVPQRDSYYHHTFITAQAFSAFPPEITAQCSDRGILFNVITPHQAASLWEVGVNHEPLTSELAAQRGYKLINDGQKTILEVPVFSVGYAYEDINLSNFYGTFKLLLRDARTLEVQTSTSKHCLFKTEDMIVCSADGTMTVVTTPTSTWPTVDPQGTSLLDRTCRPKQTDITRVLFEFKLDSCGTRITVGETYVVYENEILHDRQLIADGPTFISRDSQFKLTVRCFYPLSGINRLTVDRVFSSKAPGIGLVKVFGSLTDSNLVSTLDCLSQVPGNAINSPSEPVKEPNQPSEARRVEPTPSVRPWPKPAHSSFITIPGGQNNQELNLQKQQSKFNLPRVNEHIPALRDVDKSVATSDSTDVNRVKGSGLMQPWLPLDQTGFVKPTQLHRNIKSEPSDTQQALGPLKRLTHQDRRPGYAPEIYLESQVLPIPAGFIQTPIEVNDPSVYDYAETRVDIKMQETESAQREPVIVQSGVQNIRVKPQRRLTFENPSQEVIHTPSYSPSRHASGPTAAANKHQTPEPPDNANLQVNQQHVVQIGPNTPDSVGKQSSTLKKVIHTASSPLPGSPGTLLGSSLGFLLPDHGKMSGRVPAINVLIKSSPDFSNKELTNHATHGKQAMNPTEGNLGSRGSSRGPGGTGVDLKTSGMYDCGVSDQYSASVHHGIVRTPYTSSSS
ncbi:uncharacterized protein LOC129172433 isoform X2 [Dunckerocampus dactyliophorus]|uniref:uncharacterized protein LOC129172433 isoform X2 n=1 Tax=Dunckerocampus dactyliophorus TaxID=161453 RepID=UPI002405AB85|nr:uncharacterized protein LOC129172433 isoform X2 [Dunckerocampus dactyliophorus]